LSDVLERGTGDKAFSQYGLKKFPVAGKTGTAYNFTDDWFIGYDSAITCGVWAGFDKPSAIYRGAFSNEVTLPIWVDVMNATFAKYPAKEIPQPRGLKKYEICLSSGQLATDKCFEMITDKTTGESHEHRTTYFEIATEEQAPKQACTVHGEGGKSIAAATMPISNVPSQSQYPRATLAVDLAKVTAVPMKGPTVIGDEDPYNSVKPTIVLPALRASDGAPPPAASGSPGSSAAPAASPEPTEVRRAEPVRALDQPVEDDTIKLEPPPPMQF
jgi:penicillin-binding protein 1A